MKKRTIITTIILCAFMIFIVILMILPKKDFLAKQENGYGNTAGNLNNLGMFSEKDGYVFFRNTYDNNYLYRMKSDGSDVTKIAEIQATYINIGSEHVYFTCQEFDSSLNPMFQKKTMGIYVCSKSGKKLKRLFTEASENTILVNDQIFTSVYKTGSINKILLTDESSSVLLDEFYNPVCVNGDTMFLIGVDTNHNLYQYSISNDTLYPLEIGNFYQLDYYNGWLYYIDLANQHKLTKRNLETNEISIINEDYCINYNLSPEHNVIYYQAENKENHFLARISLDGSNQETIKNGDFRHINITSAYVYFQEISDDITIYKMPPTGPIDITKFQPTN